MPYVVLSKTGVTTFQTSRGHVYPYNRPKTWNQYRVPAENKLVVRIVTMGPRERWLRMHFTLLPQEDYDGLDAFLMAPAINGMGGTFTCQDQDGIVYPTVRWWPDSDPPTLDWPQTGYRQYSGDLIVRVEA